MHVYNEKDTQNHYVEFREIDSHGAEIRSGIHPCKISIGPVYQRVGLQHIVIYPQNWLADLASEILSNFGWQTSSTFDCRQSR